MIVFRFLYRVFFPAALLVAWVCFARMIGMTCAEEGSSDFYFYWWLIGGMPYGLRAMHSFTVLRGGGLQESIGVLALNFVIAGLIGGFAVIARVFRLVHTLCHLAEE